MWYAQRNINRTTDEVENPDTFGTCRDLKQTPLNAMTHPVGGVLGVGAGDCHIALESVTVTSHFSLFSLIRPAIGMGGLIGPVIIIALIGSVQDQYSDWFTC